MEPSQSQRLLARVIGHLRLVLGDLEELAAILEEEYRPEPPVPVTPPIAEDPGIDEEPGLEEDERDPNTEIQLPRPPEYRIKLKELIDAGVIKTPITIHTTVGKFPAQATLHKDGSIEYQGNTYKSLSAVGRVITAGVWPRVNGWTFWGVMHNHIFTTLFDIRKEYAQTLTDKQSQERRLNG